jgi:UDP-N-acetylmuramyl pentapeptide phosphotransferase/UDP-N-acetylglucosamine-1-phosphate transferase
MLLALAYVAGKTGDFVIQSIALTVVGAVMGFFVWNFPAGLIFMGDGGAYFLGFLLAEVRILLLNRNAGVSPTHLLLFMAGYTFLYRSGSCQARCRQELFSQAACLS